LLFSSHNVTLDTNILVVPKPKIQTSVKMRQIQWTKVATQNISKTIWNNLAEKGKDGEERTRREKIDIKELELLFCAVAPSAGGANSAKKAEVIVEKEKDKVIVLLDAKTSNNLSMHVISLTYFRHHAGKSQDSVPRAENCNSEHRREHFNRNASQTVYAIYPDQRGVYLNQRISRIKARGETSRAWSSRAILS
jgi:hypothetical protein